MQNYGPKSFENSIFLKKKSPPLPLHNFPTKKAYANTIGAFCTNQNAAAAMSALQISTTAAAAAAAAGAPAVMAPGISNLGALSR